MVRVCGHGDEDHSLKVVRPEANRHSGGNHRLADYAENIAVDWNTCVKDALWVF